MVVLFSTPKHEISESALKSSSPASCVVKRLKASVSNQDNSSEFVVISSVEGVSICMPGVVAADDTLFG